jgi:hypothetical protein
MKFATPRSKAALALAPSPLSAYTIPEVMIAAAILTIAVGGLIVAQLSAFRLNAFVSPKIENARYARQTLGTMIEEVRCANSIQVGTGSIGAFTAAGMGSPQCGNALKIFTTTNRYIYYFADSSSATLKKVPLSGSTPTTVAVGLTNSVVFTMEDFKGAALTNSQNNAVMSILMQMRRGWNSPGASDNYEVRAKITRRNIL